ncbi:EIF5 [Cordylochernes scorpioides]|uniref:Eukaryotic translation initiation factor 5 n=1 Tax=Cordylochernes scorpioides TaxID=51811 RepID=A0ABY6LP96_9ARAC|nr:EIF5 [Cordylochernes scorpioides]
MGSVNINRNLADQFYRYKMPKLITKVEGKGNGIKTVIVNMVEVAKALNRPPTYPTKYFGCELGAQTKFDIKAERYIVNGSHEAAKLQDLLDGFIKRFVLCPACGNPETILGVQAKKGVISTSCKACGHQGFIDTTHKLATYIMKNPPDVDPAITGASVQSGKKNKRKSKDESKSVKKQQNGDDGSHNVSDNSLPDNGHGENLEEDDWSVDTDAESVAKRMENLTLGAKGLMHNNDLEKPLQERLDIFFEFVKKYNSIINASAVRDIVAESERLELRDKAILIICVVLLNENIISQIKAYKILFLKFTSENLKAQKYLMGGIEQVINEHKEVLLPKVVHILKTLYDEDILDEEAILEWGVKPSKKYVSKELAQEIHEKAQPFLRWLKEAEEEDESSEEEENVEVVYSDRVRSTTLQEIKEPPAPKSPPEEEEEDDLDIDAI